MSRKKNYCSECDKRGLTKCDQCKGAFKINKAHDPFHKFVVCYRAVHFCSVKCAKEWLYLNIPVFEGLIEGDDE